MIKKITVVLLILTATLTSAKEMGVQPLANDFLYVVKKDETLYQIAARYGLDYHALAALNHMDTSEKIYVGETLKIQRTPPKTAPVFQSKPYELPTRVAVHQVKKPIQTVLSHQSDWYWPLQGALRDTFSKSKKGIQIAGEYGAPVFATAPGTVVYSGNGIRGYGNLIIIKHNSHYLSAYAYNSRVLVRNGQEVKSGEKIAEVGNNHSKEPTLYFEIRRAGNPVNPLRLLAKR